MLLSLTIKNIALIDELTLNFSDGLTILTGETGAGKSIIVDSLNLILGERASKELIQTGKDSAYVEAYFDDIPKKSRELFYQNGIEYSDGVVFSRELSVSGKSICRVNGKLVPLNILKDLSSELVDLLGQHEHQSLLDEKIHLEFLDNFLGKNQIKTNVKNLFHEYKQLSREFSQVREKITDSERKLDLLNYQISEIQSLNYRDGELDELKLRQEALKNSETIEKSLYAGYEELYSGQTPALQKLKNAINAISDIKDLDKRYAVQFEKLNEAYYSIEEIAFDIRGLKDDCYYSESELDDIVSRIEAIEKVMRKYGGDMQSALKFLSDSILEQEELLNGEDLVNKIKQKLDEKEAELKEMCNKLTCLRKDAAKKFEQTVIRELGELGLGGSSFEVRFLSLDNYAESGLDDVEFYISTNRGETVKPLKKVASGGEISRIMLAFKLIGVSGINTTLIFDEIDTGISGKIAHVVSEKLKKISLKFQTICVTHLPQIAAKGDTHFLISKHVKNGKTRTEVTLLGEKLRIGEIARLAGGETDSAHALAKELISNNAIK